MSLTRPADRPQMVPYMEDPRLTRYSRADIEEQKLMLENACRKHPSLKRELIALRQGINPRTRRNVNMDGPAYRTALDETLQKIEGDFWLHTIPNPSAYIAQTEEMYHRYLIYNIRARIINRMIADLETI